MAITTGDGLVAAMAGGRVTDILKIGTAAEAAGNYYCFSKDTGFPVLGRLALPASMVVQQTARLLLMQAASLMSILSRSTST